jgi:hypothetical protein
MPEMSIKHTSRFNVIHISGDRWIYYASYLTAIIGGLAAAYFTTGGLAEHGAAKVAIAAYASIADSAGFIVTNLAAYVLFHLQHYKGFTDWQQEIRKDSKALLFSGAVASILAATLRGLLHYVLMLASVDERIAMFIGYCGAGGLPTYFKYKSDLKNNIVEKSPTKTIREQAATWQEF